MAKKFLKSDILSDKSYSDKVSFFKVEQFNEVLDQAQRAWSNLDEFRRKRERCKRYTFGNQWGDLIRSPRTGETMTEEQYILNQGKVPLKNNLIRQLTKTIVGQYRSSPSEPVCIARARDEQSAGEMLSMAIQCVYQYNDLEELDARSLEEFLISGVAVGKVTYAWDSNRSLNDVKVDSIAPNNVFFNSNLGDVRLKGLNLIGELHNVTIQDIVSTFAKSEADANYIKTQYSYGFWDNSYDTLEPKSYLETSFGVDMSGMCRLIEVWRKESKPRYKCHDTLNAEWFKIEEAELSNINSINKARIAEYEADGIPLENIPLIETEWFVDKFWQYYFLTPTGVCLKSGESPYAHGEHPYAVRIYPLIDNEVHSFVADIIDQQRYINRLISMIDFIMGASAKGVLMFPEESLPDQMSMDDIADRWASYDDMILYKAKAGVAPPQQVSANSTNIGAFELLQIQLKLLNDVSGVQGALQGKDAKSGTAASLYAQQVGNAATNLKDILAFYQNYRQERDRKIMKTIVQYYKEPRYIGITGKSYQKEASFFSPEKVRNLDFDLTIKESSSAPMLRMLNDDLLMQLFEKQAISIEQMLELGSFPFADRLLQSIDAKKAEMQQQQMSAMQGQQMAAMQGQAIPPELMGEVAQSAAQQQTPQQQQMMTQFMNS